MAATIQKTVSGVPTAPPGSGSQATVPPSPPKLLKDDKPLKLPKDTFREAIETIVFVVVLVLLLKLFVVEAYVIPTGSMAETLYGYHKQFECPECRHAFAVNCSEEVVPQDGIVKPVRDCVCPNCGYQKQFTPTSPSPGSTSGDRVLVHKTWYHIDPPRRWDTVVFKYPEDPQKKHEPMNYIKRLWSTGNETIAIHRGEVFASKDRFGASQTTSETERDSWKAESMNRDTKESLTAFQQSQQLGFVGKTQFELLRKPDVVVMAERRLVYDNEHQSKTLIEKGAPPRWASDPGRSTGSDWRMDDPQAPRKFTRDGSSVSFLRYQHLTENAWVNPPNAKPAPIRNVMGYNSPSTVHDRAGYWAPDLMIECRAVLNDGTVTLELSKGADRFQSRFADGKVTIVRITSGREQVMAERVCPVSRSGSYDLRFANIDCRLRVWVNGKAVDFNGETDYPLLPVAEYDPLDTGKEGWTKANDLDAPASIGAAGRVEISLIKLWRDTVYTVSGSDLSPAAYADYVNTFFVQPDHSFVLGDNSAQSSDSRWWGVVPQRLMLGRACFIFMPLPRIGFIR